MEELFRLQSGWGELVFRGALVYFGILLFMRFSPRREVGRFTPFDLVIVLIISEAVSPALTGDEKSWSGGMVLVGTLLAINWVVGEINFRSRRMERLLEGEPVLLVRDGKLCRRALRRLRISNKDLLSVLRQNGCARPSEVALAVAEPNGSISVKKRDG